MSKESFIGLELSGSGIETAVQTWRNVEDNPLVHNSVVKSVINIMDKSVKD